MTKPRFDHAGEGPNDEVLGRIRTRMDTIDAQPAEVRALVHEFGWACVNAFLLLGVSKAKHIRHLIEAVQQSAAFGDGGATLSRRCGEIGSAVGNHRDPAVHQECIDAFMRSIRTNTKRG